MHSWKWFQAPLFVVLHGVRAVMTCACASGETEKEKQRDRERETERKTDRERERERERASIHTFAVGHGVEQAEDKQSVVVIGRTV